MNLSLEQANGIHVLKITGDIDIKGTAILKAGLTKLLKDGKDKIILDLVNTTDVHEDFIPLVNSLNELAVGLMGKIVLTNANPTIAEKIKSISSTAAFAITATTEAALSEFVKPFSVEGMPPDQIAKILQQRDARIQALEQQVALSSPDEIRKLRQENATLQEVGNKMELQIMELMKERRLPPDADAVLEKVSLLERNLQEMSASLQAGGNAKK